MDQAATTTMTTGTMATEAAQTRHDLGLMQLMWLASPALPIGGFSYSECLEAAVDLAWAATEKEAAAWLLDQLHLSLARSDLAVVAQAVPAWQAGDVARIASLNAWVLQTRESSELRAQTEQMGRSLLDWLRNLQQASSDQLRLCASLPVTYPLAMALARIWRSSKPISMTIPTSC